MLHDAAPQSLCEALLAAGACIMKHAASTTFPVTVTESDSGVRPGAAKPADLGSNGLLRRYTALNTLACVARRFRTKAATASCSASSSCSPRFGQGAGVIWPTYVRQRLSSKVFAPRAGFERS